MWLLLSAASNPVSEVVVLENHLRNGSRACAWNWSGKQACPRITNGAVPAGLQMAQWTRRTGGQDRTNIDGVKQKWRPWVRNATLTSGGAKSDEFQSGRMRSSAKDGNAGGVCRRPSSRERPQAKSLTSGFVAGLHAYNHDGPLWWLRIGCTGLRRVSWCVKSEALHVVWCS